MVLSNLLVSRRNAAVGTVSIHCVWIPDSYTNKYSSDTRFIVSYHYLEANSELDSSGGI